MGRYGLPPRLRVLITGATSGIGRELAVQLAREGCRLAVTGRRQAKLDDCARAVMAEGSECLALLGDVSSPEDVKRHYAAVREKWGGLDWAILNAGVGERNSALEFSAETTRWIFATNVGGVANWLEAVLPDMLAAKSGVVAGMSSLAAFRGGPATGAYCASKAAVYNLLESARVDLRGTGVDVVTICPGFVKSEITDRNDPKEMPILLSVEEGARRVIKAVKARRRVAHFPWRLSVPMIYLIHNLPGFLYDPLAARFLRRSKKPYVDESKRARP
jgi:short-subunit dehydrogenase